ncbi:hypothetical protein DLM78_20955 [Leptospira stimsonii]|uniref:Uncharacterized protein n=1 Tax=Leptospira stimsonii TaxID=2202203 RepID=A0A8B3CLL5_9LEPT|nr:hypothetical protein DLM78_20955 [Leptospira stimsonii]
MHRICSPKTPRIVFEFSFFEPYFFEKRNFFSMILSFFPKNADYNYGRKSVRNFRLRIYSCSYI